MKNKAQRNGGNEDWGETLDWVEVGFILTIKVRVSDKRESWRVVTRTWNLGL